MVDGVCDARFAKVREVFASSFERGEEIGASFAVTLAGKSVIDLWGGYKDASKTNPWHDDTIVKVASTSKGITAFLAHMLMNEGRLDVDEPVATYWPEFAVAGKQAITVRHLMSHTAGLSTWTEPITFDDCADWEKVTSLLAAQETLWPPGERSGYHMVTFGYLVGEVIRRITGVSVGTYLRSVADPIRLDMHIGVGLELDARVADDVPDYGDQSAADVWGAMDETTIAFQTFTNPPPPPEMTAEQVTLWRRMEMPAGNAHTNARSLARLFSIYANEGKLDGVAVLAPNTVQQAGTIVSDAIDEVFGMQAQWTLGYLRNYSGFIYGPNTETFGHSGSGGSFGFADPVRQVSVGYAPNRLTAGLAGDPRTLPLIAAVYECLDA